MSLYSSSQFASALATGTDWRDTSKAVLEALEETRTDGFAFNFGFLYITDHLAGDAESILNLFKSVLGIEHWVGGVGVGVCGCGQGAVDKPAISAMIGRIEADDFCVFPPVGDKLHEAAKVIEPWMEKTDPVLVVAHGDPLSEHDLIKTMDRLSDMTGGFVVGGLTSSRNEQVQFADSISGGGLSGAAFSSRVPVATALSQGCREIGPVRTVTRGDGNVIYELDHVNAIDAFEDDIRSMTIKTMDVDPDEILIDEDDGVPEEFRSLLKGEVHAALTVSESDQKDYMVRHIIGVDPDEGSISLATTVARGDRILFVKRDEESVFEDMSKSLLSLRSRVQRDEGVFEPKGALYISCIARVLGLPEEDRKKEMDLIREIIGDVPLCGFFAGGEINNAKLYGYTGLLVLFL